MMVPRKGHVHQRKDMPKSGLLNPKSTRQQEEIKQVNQEIRLAEAAS